MRARHMTFLALAVILVAPLSAQQPPQGRQGQRPEAAARRQAMARAQQPRMQAGLSPEMVLRLREQLSLTDAQVNRLEALRQEGIAARRDRMGEMLDLRSQLEAGRITREQLQEQVRARAEAARGAAQQGAGERVRAVLNDQQRVRLAELQVQRLQREVRMQRGARQAPRAGAGRGAGPAPRPMMRRQAPGRMPRLQDRPMLRSMRERRMAPARVPGGRGGEG